MGLDPLEAHDMHGRFRHCSDQVERNQKKRIGTSRNQTDNFQRKFTEPNMSPEFLNPRTPRQRGRLQLRVWRTGPWDAKGLRKEIPKKSEPNTSTTCSSSTASTFPDSHSDPVLRISDGPMWCRVPAWVARIQVQNVQYLQDQERGQKEMCSGSLV